jgi:hypothetical protein
MGSRDRYALAGRRVRIVFSFDDGLGTIQRVEVDGRGELNALQFRLGGLPAKWTRRLDPQHLQDLVELFREVDFFSVAEQAAGRDPRCRERRELTLIIGGRVHRVCDGLPAPTPPGGVLRPGRNLSRIYRMLVTLADPAGEAPARSV